LIDCGGLWTIREAPGSAESQRGAGKTATGAPGLFNLWIQTNSQRFQQSQGGIADIKLEKVFQIGLAVFLKI